MATATTTSSKASATSTTAARTPVPGFWASSGSDLGAGVVATLAQMTQEQLAGLLGLLDGLHALGFSTGSQRSREQLLRNVGLMGAAPAAGMNTLTSPTLAIAYCAPIPKGD